MCEINALEKATAHAHMKRARKIEKAVKIGTVLWTAKAIRFYMHRSGFDAVFFVMVHLQTARECFFLLLLFSSKSKYFSPNQ